MAQTRPGGPRREGSPAALPQGTPEGTGAFDHSFTLQAVMQMQKDLGVLGEKIDRMREDFGDLKGDGKATRDKVHDVEKSIAKFKGAMVVIGFVYTAALAIFGIFLTAYLRSPPQTVIYPASAPVMSQPGVVQEKGAAEATPVVNTSAPKGRD